MVLRLNVVYVLLLVLNRAFVETIVLATCILVESGAPSVDVFALILQFHPRKALNKARNAIAKTK